LSSPSGSEAQQNPNVRVTAVLAAFASGHKERAVQLVASFEQSDLARSPSVSRLIEQIVTM
jgi:hypothetical protein